MAQSSASSAAARSTLARARRWIAVAFAASALVYVAYGVVSGMSETSNALTAFSWPLYAVVLITTLGNYGLRYLKWVYLLSKVGVTVPHSKNMAIYAIGLSMTLSPAKAGELVKPYLVREVVGAPMARTIPVLVAERVTDAFAVLGLAAVGVSTYARDQTWIVAVAIAFIGAGVVGMLYAPLAHVVIRLISALPVVGRFGDKLSVMYTSLRACLAPGPLLITLLLSAAAWWLECLGTWLVLLGFGVDASLGLATFIYAFATALGAVSPGGVGVADATLVEGARRLIPGITLGTATAVALLVRVATLWFGVVLGAIALLGVERLVTSEDES